MTRPLSFSLLLTAVLASGCARTGSAGGDTDPAAAGPGNAVTADAAAGPFDWSRFPESDTLLIGQFPATVSAARLEAIRAPVAGHFHLAPGAVSAGRLADGASLGAIEADDRADAQRDLDERSRAVDELAARYQRDGQPAELDRLDGEITAAREALALARLAARSPDLFAGDTPALDPTLKPALTPAGAEERLHKLEERRRRVAAGDPSEASPELRAARADLEHRRRLAEESQARTRLSAPFAGTLRLACDDGARVEAGELLGTIEDDSELEIRVRGRLPLLHAVPPTSLACTLAVPGGTEATGRFWAVGVEMDGTTPVPVYRFRLSGDAWNGPGMGLSGAELGVLVSTRLPARGRIVPKLELARRDSGGALTAGWNRGLADLFPGCRVLAEGRADVAVLPPPSGP